RLRPVDADLDADAMGQRERVQLVDDIVAWFALEPIDGGNVGEKIKLEVGLVAQRAKKIVRAFAIDCESLLVALILRAENNVAEACFQFFNQHQTKIAASPNRARHAARRKAARCL